MTCGRRPRWKPSNVQLEICEWSVEYHQNFFQTICSKCIASGSDLCSNNQVHHYQCLYKYLFWEPCWQLHGKLHVFQHPGGHALDWTTMSFLFPLAYIAKVKPAVMLFRKHRNHAISYSIFLICLLCSPIFQRTVITFHILETIYNSIIAM